MIYDFENTDFNIDLNKLNMEACSIIKKTACPYCRDKNISKYGYTAKGRKRYICKSCGRTFGDTTGTPIYHSKKNISEWIKYIEYMAKSDTLREISSKLNISLTTSFQWRHKILNAIKDKIMKVKFCDNVEIAEAVMRKNYKGNHHGKIDYRDAYPEIRILSCIDENNRMLRGVDEPFIRKANLDHILKGKIKDGSIITTARNMSYVEFAHENNLKMNMFQCRRFNIDSNLNNKRANMQGRYFLSFTKGFNGIATRYTNFYSNLYIIMIMNENNGKNIFRELFNDFFVSKYILKERNFKNIKLSELT